MALPAGSVFGLDLCAAIKEGHVIQVERALAKGASPDAPNRAGDTPLVCAVRARNVAALRVLLSRGADVNRPDRAGFSPLIHSADTSSSAIAKLLLENGANPNARNAAGDAPAHIAAAADDAAMIAVLFSTPSFRVDILNGGGSTPAAVAAAGGKAAALKVLFSAGASKTANPDLLFLAVLSASTDTAKAVVDAGYDVDAGKGRAIRAAAERGDMDMLRLLVERGASVDMKGEDGLTPDRYADLKKQPAAAMFLRSSLRPGRK